MGLNKNQFNAFHNNFLISHNNVVTSSLFSIRDIASIETCFVS